MKSLPLPLIFVKAMPITLSGKIQEILCKTPAESVGLERENYIDDLTASADLSYFLSEDLNIIFGGQLKNYEISYESSFEIGRAHV